MSIRKYLLDENVSHAYRTALHRQWPEMEVWLIGSPGAPKKGTLDPDILNWCEENGFSLVTNNRASMPEHLERHLSEGRSVPGIFILNPNLTMGATIAELGLIWLATTREEYANQLNYLPLSY